MTDSLKHFPEVWLCDFEFSAPPGERPKVVCMVAREFRSRATIRLFAEELLDRATAPFACGAQSLFVAYFAPAEIGCFLNLGWRTPERVLDLFCEFRNMTNGLGTIAGNSLLGALSHFGIDGVDAAEKSEMRELAMRGSDFSPTERSALLNYCESDVNALEKLLPAMLPHIDLSRALVRGRYMVAVARMGHTGVPIDTDYLNRLRNSWAGIKENLVKSVDSEYGVYDGQTFRRDRFAAWLIRNEIPWPQLESGQLDMSDDTFREMSRSVPAVTHLCELRHTMSGMRLEKLAVGADSRNRCVLSPFSSRTGRNQPSNSQFIFGPSCWLRGLIRPEEGRAIAYIDWSQQEWAIAAALSGDDAMQAAYRSSDPYLTFAIQAGAAPENATRESHKKVREQFKICALAVQYGMGEKSLAHKLNQPPIVARQLLQLHRSTYPKFWAWSTGAVDHAMLHGWIQTTFGWRIQVGPAANPRSLANFPCQANGAEMLRFACCLATEAGIEVCAPIHDALLIEAPVAGIEEAVARTQAAMVAAGNTVLGDFEMRSDVKIHRFPESYMDPRGEKMWQTVAGILAELERADRCLGAGPVVAQAQQLLLR